MAGHVRPLGIILCNSLVCGSIDFLRIKGVPRLGCRIRAEPDGQRQTSLGAILMLRPIITAAALLASSGIARAEDFTAAEIAKLPRDMVASVKRMCAERWPDDFSQRLFCENAQYESIRTLIERGSVHAPGAASAQKLPETKPLYESTTWNVYVTTPIDGSTFADLAPRSLSVETTKMPQWPSSPVPCRRAFGYRRTRTRGRYRQERRCRSLSPSMVSWSLRLLRQTATQCLMRPAAKSGLRSMTASKYTNCCRRFTTHERFRLSSRAAPKRLGT
jgi:hypothetical protein